MLTVSLPFMYHTEHVAYQNIVRKRPWRGRFVVAPLRHVKFATQSHFVLLNGLAAGVAVPHLGNLLVWMSEIVSASVGKFKVPTSRSRPLPNFKSHFTSCL